MGDEHSVDPCMNTVANHLITASLECVVIILHNHPSLSKFSLEDVKFFLNNGTVKMMVVVTNLGNISYLVKRENYNRGDSAYGGYLGKNFTGRAWGQPYTCP